MISFSPSEEQQMIITMMRQFAGDEMRKIYRECDETGQIPRAVIKKAWDTGIITGYIPQSCGGGGEEHSALTGALIAEELAWGDLSIALEVLHPMLVAVPLLNDGSAAQIQRHLADFCGDAPPRATAALTEPRFGFDPLELQTRPSP